MNRTKQITSVFLTALAVMLFVINMAKNPQGPLPASAPVLDSYAEQHLLYGDKRGGGHLHGAGKACKSEFPESWNREDVINHVKNVAANDNLDWEKQPNGYYVAEEMVEDIRVRVVLNQTRTKIITSYPTNVERNPCPRGSNKIPANDNDSD